VLANEKPMARELQQPLYAADLHESNRRLPQVTRTGRKGAFAQTKHQNWSLPTSDLLAPRTQPHP